MSTENYFQIFRSAIARIYNTNGKVVGAGFLVSQQHLVTCAHVVTAALGIVTNTPDSPDGIIEVDFPLIAPGQKVKAKVVFWQPVNPGQSKEDIAGLQIEETLPIGVSPVQLVTTSNYWQHKFRIFGFPQGHDTGVWAEGELRDIQATRWIQMEAIKVPGYQIEPGFSGSPIWDESLQGVVGMAVAAEKKREGVKAAFMMPTTVLVETWDFLNQAVQKPITPLLPPYLPHLCNRTEQKSQIEDAYQKFKKENSYRSLVFIIHGDEKQCHRSFLERMQTYILPNSIESLSPKFYEHFLEWPAKLKKPDNDDLPNRLLKNLYEAMSKKVDFSEDKIKEVFFKSSNNLIFHTELTTKNWQEQGFNILDDLLHFCQSLYKKNIIEKDLIICIFIKYKPGNKTLNIVEWIKSILTFENNLFKKIHDHRTDKKIRNYLNSFAYKKSEKSEKFHNFLIIPLEELESVTKDEVITWTHHYEVKKVCNNANYNKLVMGIDNIFKSSESIPMMELEDYLLNLLGELT